MRVALAREPHVRLEPALGVFLERRGPIGLRLPRGLEHFRLAKSEGGVDLIRCQLCRLLTGASLGLAAPLVIDEDPPRALPGLHPDAHGLPPLTIWNESYAYRNLEGSSQS